MFRNWRSGLRLVIIPLVFFASAAALAVEPDEVLSDPALEARARALSAELRCVVCQNQSIDDSNAPLARDLRLLLRERLVAGDSDSEVKQYLVQRYGTFVLLKPPLDERTMLLWLAPLLILGAAVLLLLRYFGSARKAQTEGRRTLSREEEERLRALLAKNDGTSDR